VSLISSFILYSTELAPPSQGGGTGPNPVGGAKAMRMNPSKPSYGSLVQLKYRTSVALVLLSVSGLLFASCSTTTAQGSIGKNFNTPLHAAYSWFEAINQKQRSSMIAHAAPAAEGMMNWNGGVTSMWPSFTHVSCAITNSTRSISNLLCTFKEKAAPGNQIDTFWTMSLERSASGKWLITNYGQG
jgi:hypothetical protein